MQTDLPARNSVRSGTSAPAQQALDQATHQGGLAEAYN